MTGIINFIFHGSVEALIVLARLLGMTYVAKRLEMS